MFSIPQPYGNALSTVACFLFILIICEFSEQISGDSRGEMMVAWTYELAIGVVRSGSIIAII